jgi:hypothetical protein
MNFRMTPKKRQNTTPNLNGPATEDRTRKSRESLYPHSFFPFTSLAPIFFLISKHLYLQGESMFHRGLQGSRSREGGWEGEKERERERGEREREKERKRAERQQGGAKQSLL